MAVDFPSPAVNGQLYPDTAAGDPPLDNGRVYIFDGAAGIWNLQPASGGGGSPISGGLELSAVPKLVQHDSWERSKSEIWNYKMDDGSTYKCARDACHKPNIHASPIYWDDRWWVVMTSKEFGSEIYTSDDDGLTWTPHSRISTEVEYTGTGNYTKYISTMYGWMSNDDCLIIATRWFNNTSDTYFHRIKKGEDSFTQVWKRGDFGANDIKSMSTVGGALYAQMDYRKVMRSFDNGDSWELVDMTLTNGELYSSYSNQIFIELPDGRMAVKWGVKPTGETQYSYQIIASDDQGETWTILDSDLDATYQYSSGVPARNVNTSNLLGLWVANGVVFSCVGLRGVDEADGLDQRYISTTNYVVFYTTDISSGVWNYAAKSALHVQHTFGFYNPNDQRYYSTTSKNHLMCSLPGSLDSDGWRFLDKAGYFGLNGSTQLTKQQTLLDERNNRLAFVHAGTYTFDYYTFEATIKGVGADEYQNRLVTFDDLDNYVKAPLLMRHGSNAHPNSNKLALTSSRRNSYGKNYANIAQDQMNASHYYELLPENHNNAYPKVGQLGLYTAWSGSNLPEGGRGPNGWIGISMKSLNGYWAIGGYYFTTKNGSTEHVVESPGALWLSGYDTINGSTNGYPLPYVVIPFTKFSAKNYRLWFDYDRSKILYPAGWNHSSQYPTQWSQLEYNKYFLYQVTGLPFVWHNYAHEGAAGFSKRPTLNYRD